MSATDVGHVDARTADYAAGVVEAIRRHLSVVGAYLLGSAASGTFDPATSDLDLAVVVEAAPDAPSRGALLVELESLERPVQRLELVIYERGQQPPDFALNLNVDGGGTSDRPDEAAHWFVIDAAIGQDTAVVLSGPPWSSFFAEISKDQLGEALVQSIAWSEAQPVGDEFARVNAVRSRHYLETGEWLSKREARR
jgi:predicted nucleotidyltransferase